MDNEREQSKFLIQRYDNYISGANTKGNFILAFTTFLIGGIITNYNKLKELVGSDNGLTLLNFCLIALIIAGLVGTVFVIKAVYPFLVSGNSSKEKYHSCVFFNSVAEFDSANIFYNSYSKQTNEEVELDLATQAYYLAKGLKKKYCHLEWAMRIVYVILLLILMLLFIILIF